jgi:hypothetical protein
MDFQGALNAKRKRERRSRARAKSGAIADYVEVDPPKARVMAYFRELVADGHAEWHALKDGTTWLRLKTGEIYLLERETITRVA